MLPIWKDKIITISTTNASIYFRIKRTTEVIYSGRAYKKPGEDSIYIRINDICADYLYNVVPTWTNTQFTNTVFPLTFNVETSTDGTTWTNRESVTFINDWSYEEDREIGSNLANPINRRIDSKQWITYTITSGTSVTAKVHTTEGDEYTLTVPAGADFSRDFSRDFARSAASAGAGTAVFNLQAYEGADYVVINNSLRFDVVSSCQRYVLYYLNTYGGWDSFLIEGNHMQTDNVTRYTRGKEYDNSVKGSAGEINYVNEIERTLVLHSGNLNTDEASRMHNLINATSVYLYDMEADAMYPVIINTNNCVYKTFKNNGHNLINYSLEVRVAQNITRR